MATPLETIRKKAKELQAVKNISYQAALKKAGADYRAGNLSGVKKKIAKKPSARKIATKPAAKKRLTLGKLKEVKKIKHCVVSGIKKPRSTSQLQMAQNLLKTFKARVESSKTTATKNHYKRQYNRVYDVINHLKKHA